jgi:hypothetical protein
MRCSAYGVVTSIVFAMFSAPALAADGGAARPCGNAGECPSSMPCVHGYCCDSPCGGGCQICNLPGQEGQCREAPFGYQSADCGPYKCDTTRECPVSCLSSETCIDGHFCATSGSEQGRCLPKRRLGQACGAECTEAGCDACESGLCVDGVCCDGLCEGQCVACSEELKGQGPGGECGPVAQGLLGRGQCDDFLPNSCLMNGLCDGRGRCEYQPEGTPCGTKQCAGNFQLAFFCDGRGNCATDVTRCRKECPSEPWCVAPGCDMDAGCDAGHRCTGDSCDADASVCTARDGGSCTLTKPCAEEQCKGYRCRDGECLHTCTSNDDCVSPARCNVEGKCVDYTDENVAPCALTGAGGASEHSGMPWKALWILGAAAGLLRARRGTARRMSAAKPTSRSLTP